MVSSITTGTHSTGAAYNGMPLADCLIDRSIACRRVSGATESAGRRELAKAESMAATAANKLTGLNWSKPTPATCKVKERIAIIPAS